LNLEGDTAGDTSGEPVAALLIGRVEAHKTSTKSGRGGVVGICEENCWLVQPDGERFGNGAKGRRPKGASLLLRAADRGVAGCGLPQRDGAGLASGVRAERPKSSSSRARLSFEAKSKVVANSNSYSYSVCIGKIYGSQVVVEYQQLEGMLAANARTKVQQRRNPYVGMPLSVAL
jgi:hypothetical protein